jgi:NAD(P)-dependent dehydrogenase (short-subunit alcohol dehydrogenase family)
MELAIEGARALITGGASGIGRTMAETFLRAGARVHVGDLDRGALELARGELPGLGGSIVDVSVPEDAVRLVTDATAAMGGLDVLVNNAGIPGPTAAVEDVEPADWQRVLDVDITGMFLVTRMAVPHLKAAGRGSIVNMSSVAGRFGFAMRSPYAAAKWAVVGFTRSIAIELGPFDINVNCIQPGAVAGRLQEQVLADLAAARGISLEQAREDRLRHVSLGRFVTQQEVADMALYLCSPMGHAVSGQAISVCGDQHALV